MGVNLALQVTILLLLGVTSSVTSSVCKRYINCFMPDCQCSDFDNGPGGISDYLTPQIVLVSTQDAINDDNEETYSFLFDGVKNPNGCPALGTFFVQGKNTSAKTVKQLHEAGHEIGVTTFDGQTPPDNSWDFQQTKEFLTKEADIPASDVIGCRAPGLAMGGNDQLTAMKTAGLTYDSSCTSYDHGVFYDSMLWPYTYDYVEDTPKCVHGSTPTKPQKGTWQFLTPQLVYKNVSNICDKPSDCSHFLKNVNETETFLRHNFLLHFNNRKTPFILDLDPDWMTEMRQIEGTRRFLRSIHSTAKHTWILTYSQALAWLKNPITFVGTHTYKAWSCNKHEQ